MTDFFPRAQQSFAKVGPRPVDIWLSQQEAKGSVMRYPFYLNDDQAGTYYTLYNEKPFIGGFFNAFPTDQYQRIRGVMEGFPSKESLALAKDLDVSYFLVEEDELLRAIEEGTIPWESPEEFYHALEVHNLSLSENSERIFVYTQE